MDRSRTKLICTIGPASAERVGELVAAGMDVARINFSHGTPDDHRAYVHAVRAAAHSARRSVAVMADLPGPKIRLGELVGGAITLETGSTFALRPAPGEGESDQPLGDTNGAVVSTAGLAAQLEAGDRVLLADGAAELRVTAISGSNVETEVVHGGPVRTRSGVNIPSSRLTGDGLTDEDRAAIPRALELRVDLIAQSFVRSADDVRALRQLLPSEGPRVVAKIETRAAIDAYDEIVKVVDGIMVARGDLGVDIPFEEVPLVQKELIEGAARADRFSIVATQMLESMTAAPRPTRAEVSDVANAVLDGTDAVMLSAETAIGAYPVEALQAMARICLATERQPGVDHVPARDGRVTPATAVILAATAATGWTDIGSIWCFTRTGHTAEKLAMTRPGVPIVAFTLSPIVARRLAVRRGVIPMILPAAGKGGTLIERMELAWRAQRDHSSYETVILVTTSQQPGGINRFEVHRLTGQVASAG
jgi:pyruvate kinase